MALFFKKKLKFMQLHNKLFTFSVMVIHSHLGSQCNMNFFNILL